MEEPTEKVGANLRRCASPPDRNLWVIFLRLLFIKGPDISNLRPPIHTSVTGMKQAVHALETGSLEVKRCLLNEANLIYECKVVVFCMCVRA